jgi:8-oxo-dGTP pyrophosphatase MutT (NUDIX family)
MKLPEHAKLVFKGIIYNVYQWDQERFDGSHATYEMLKRPDTVLVIPTTGNKILISKQTQPHTKEYYSLFGGRMEENEEPLVAAKREFLEETGYESADWKLIKTYEPFSKMDWNIYLFIARGCKKVGEQTLDPGEKIEILEVSFDEFIDLIRSDKFWGGELALDLFRMEKEGKLEEFRQKLFNHASD